MSTHCSWEQIAYFEAERHGEGICRLWPRLAHYPSKFDLQVRAFPARVASIAITLALRVAARSCTDTRATV